MFDSLDEQMRIDANKECSARERMFRWALYVLLAVLIFAAVIFGVHSMQG